MDRVKEEHDPFADGRRITERVEQWKKDNPAPPPTADAESTKKRRKASFTKKKGPALRKGVAVFRWNGIGDDEGVVIKKSKEYLHIDWNGTKEEIEVALFKYQMKILDGEVTWRWKAPAREHESVKDVRIEGDWEKTYDHTGNLVTMKLLAVPGS